MFETTAEAVAALKGEASYRRLEKARNEMLGLTIPAPVAAFVEEYKRLQSNGILGEANRAREQYENQQHEMKILRCETGLPDDPLSQLRYLASGKISLLGENLLTEQLRIVAKEARYGRLINQSILSVKHALDINQKSLWKI